MVKEKDHKSKKQNKKPRFEPFLQPICKQLEFQGLNEKTGSAIASRIIDRVLASQIGYEIVVMVGVLPLLWAIIKRLVPKDPS